MFKSKHSIRSWTGGVDSIYILTPEYIKDNDIVTGQGELDKMVKETGIELQVWKPAEIDNGAREAKRRRIRNRNAKTGLIKVQ